MDQAASIEDEIYYTSKNFMKLKFSNTEYIKNTTNEKLENEQEIENLKKEYDKLKQEVVKLKKDTLYASNKTKLGSTTLDSNEINFLKLKLDKVKNEKLKVKEEWKKNDEKLKAIKYEYKQLCDDNNPYTKRIKMLENKLDKAMIKYNEAMSIKRTYEQILNRLKEERSGFDNQVGAIQKSLKAKQQDCNEFMLLLQDAKQAKGYSELLLKNTELSKEAFEQYFEKLLREHDQKGREDERDHRLDNRKKIEKTEIRSKDDDADMAKINKENEELEEKVNKFEKANKKIRETTGADDINEICQKYSNLGETKDKLKKEKIELGKTCDYLTKKKDELAMELNALKYQSQDEITRKEIEDNEKTVERTQKSCETSKYKLKKSEKLINDIKAGVNTITNIIKDKIFDEIFSDDKNFTEKESLIKHAYKEVYLKADDKELRFLLSKMQEVCEFIYLKYKYSIDYEYYEENNKKLTQKEENELEQIYLKQSVQSLEDSYSNNEDDELNEKDYNLKSDNINNNYNFNFRSQTADAKFKRNKITLKPIDKRNIK